MYIYLVEIVRADSVDDFEYRVLLLLFRQRLKQYRRNQYHAVGGRRRPFVVDSAYVPMANQLVYTGTSECHYCKRNIIQTLENWIAIFPYLRLGDRRWPLYGWPGCRWPSPVNDSIEGCLDSTSWSSSIYTFWTPNKIHWTILLRIWKLCGTIYLDK